MNGLGFAQPDLSNDVCPPNTVAIVPELTQEVRKYASSSRPTRFDPTRRVRDQRDLKDSINGGFMESGMPGQFDQSRKLNAGVRETGMGFRPHVEVLRQ